MATQDKATEKTGEQIPSDATIESARPAPADAAVPKTSSGKSLKGRTSSVGAPKDKSKPPQIHPMPGLELLGRGIYLKPRQPYELKKRLVGPNPAGLVAPKQGKGDGVELKTCTVYCADADKSYLVPKEFEVNHSPPMPPNQTLNQTVIEYSFESLESHLEVDANVAAGNDAFTVKANYSQINQLRSSKEAYYALRTSFIPFWTLDFTKRLEESVLDLIREELPPKEEPFDKSLRAWIDDEKAQEQLDKLQNLSQEEILGFGDDLFSRVRKIGFPDDLMKLYEGDLKKPPKGQALGTVLASIHEQITVIRDFYAEQNSEQEAMNQATERDKAERFFQEYGTHFVKRVWVGGTATLAFAVTKSAETSIEQIQAGINASFGALDVGMATRQQASLATLKENSTCAVWGKGGDESALASLNTLDQTQYNVWLESVKNNAQVIELEVVGIWTLFRNEKTNKLTEPAIRLRGEYRKLYEFEPIAALFFAPAIGELSVPSASVMLIKSAAPQNVNEYVVTQETDSPRQKVWPTLEERWPRLTEIGFDRIDAAFSGTGLRSRGVKEGVSLDRKVCFFRGDRFIWLGNRPGPTPLPGDAMPIRKGWPGVEFKSIDAVLNAGPESIYFFSGDEYVRFNWTKGKADFEPRRFRQHWAGVTFDRIDAAIYWGNGKAYFFRGNRYVAYDMLTYRADPGYPKFLPGSYVEDWKIFD